jgi:hypothetical protein
VTGINELVLRADQRIHSGLIAYDAVEKLKADRNDIAARATFEKHKADLGYALLLKRHLADPRQASDAQILKAAWDTVPNVPVMFWLFRFMAGLGFFFIAFFAAAFWCASAASSTAMVPARGGGDHSAAVAGDRVRLGAGGNRPSAVGGGRRAADLPRRILADGRAGLGDDRRLHAALRHAGGDRGAADAGVDPQGTGRASRAGCAAA